MKIAIIGSGAMGCLFGGILSKVADVCLYDVNQTLVDIINEKGLMMTKAEEKEIVYPRATANPKEIGIVDAAIFFTKFTFMESAVQDALNCIGPDTFVVTLQNGIGSADVILKHVPKEQVGYGLTAYTSDLKALGHIELTTKESVDTYFWPVDGNMHKNALLLEKTMNEAGFSTHITKEVDEKIWKKLMVNCAENTMCAILRLTVGQLVETPSSFELVKSIIAEISSVAIAKGINVSPEDGLEYVMNVSHAVMHHVPSMALDVQNMRKTEIAVLNEAVVKEAQKYGIETPVLDTVAKMIRTIESNYGKFAF